MFEIKYGEGSKMWYLVHISNGVSKVLDKSYCKKWINDQYCKYVGGVKSL